jgi:hypothetical protein
MKSFDDLGASSKKQMDMVSMGCAFSSGVFRWRIITLHDRHLLEPLRQDFGRHQARNPRSNYERVAGVPNRFFSKLQSSLHVRPRSENPSLGACYGCPVADENAAFCGQTWILPLRQHIRIKILSSTRSGLTLSRYSWSLSALTGSVLLRSPSRSAGNWYQSSRVFVPQAQAKSLPDILDGNSIHCGQAWMVAHACIKSIKWNAAIEMMNMMDPDVAGEPSQWFR